MKTLTVPTLLTLLITAAPIAAPPQLAAQQNQQSDSVVAAGADAMGLPFIPPDQCPIFGTYWEVRKTVPCMLAPLPCPPLDQSMHVYAIGDPVFGGQFLVDQTTDQVMSPPAQYSRGSLSTMDAASILQAQVDELQNFVTQVQARQASAQQRANGQMSTLDGPPTPGDGDGGEGGDPGQGYSPLVYSASDLWLELLITNSFASFIIHTPDTAAYDLFGTTNLSANVPGLNLTNWVWLLRTDVGQTNNIILTNLWPDMGFFRLGTMLDSNSDGVTDAYSNLVGLNSNSDLDGDGVSDVEEMREGRNPLVAGAVADTGGLARLDVFTVLR